MQLIACVDRHWAIGSGNTLLFRIREDLQQFSALTKGHVVVMGRKTLETLPGAKPLPYRENIVLTRSRETICAGAQCCASLPMLWETLQSPPYKGKEVFVIGGAEIYELLLPYASAALITHVLAARQADCWFPRLPRLPEWQRGEVSEWHMHEGLPYVYVTYTNTAVKAP